MFQKYKLLLSISLITFASLALAMGQKPSPMTDEQKTLIQNQPDGKWQVEGNTLKLTNGIKLKKSIHLFQEYSLEKTHQNPTALSKF